MEQAIEPMSMSFPFHRPPNLAEGWEAAILAPLLVVFQAAEEGAYTITVEVDGSSKSVPMRILIAANPEQTA